MTKRDNFYELIRFGTPERIVTGPPEYGLCYMGCNHENFEGQGHHSPVGTTWVDIWGTTWHRDLEGVMGFPKAFPLEDLTKLDDFAFPDIDSDEIGGQIFRMREEYDKLRAKGEYTDCILTGSHRDTLWEKAYMLVGMENLMVYIHTEPELVKKLLHRLINFQLKAAEKYLAAGVELVNLGDDMGTQNSLLLGKKIVREFFYPEYRRLFDFYKRENILISFHSCGHIEPLLEMFMELGVDILNPIQSRANDLTKVRAMTQGRMALQGGISSAILMDGTKDDIEKEVRTKIEILGREGGYICCPDQGMPYPQENIDFMVEMVDKYGNFHRRG